MDSRISFVPCFCNCSVSSGVLSSVFGLSLCVIITRDQHFLCASATLFRYFVTGLFLSFVFKNPAHCPSALCHARPSDCFLVQFTHANPENNFKYASTSFLRSDESMIFAISLSNFIASFCDSVIISNSFFLSVEVLCHPITVNSYR